MKFLVLIISAIFLFDQVESNEPFVVLEYKDGMGQEKNLNKENIFDKNQNYSLNHKVKSGDSLSGILNKYYGEVRL